MSSQLLCLFLKNPNKEQAKSRLAKTIGKEKANKIYIQMVDYLISLAKQIKEIDIKFYLSGPSKNLPWDIKTIPQVGDNLGQRMSNMFSNELKTYKKVSLIGTDCIYETTKDLLRSFESLEKSDFILQGANDGGYTLIGMKNYYPKAFIGMPYSTNRLLKETKKYLLNANISCASLPIRFDIDYEEDLLLWLESSKNDNRVAFIRSKILDILRN
ncbi:MAG: hypothetical protein COB02_14950 [Candidatus Cloacimonadota bacterium]|nr:MAG: hypothetical protein COB02_14950 [Candidatus Cloacimonadota bacterium]